MTTRHQAAHEARRQAAREGRLTRTRQPDLVIVCERCRNAGTGDDAYHGGFVERFRWDGSAARWTATAQTPEVSLTAEDRPTDDVLGWNGDPAVRSTWPLRCPRCGNRAPARDDRLQAVAGLMAQALRGGGRPPRKLPPLTLDQLRQALRSVPNVR